MNLAIEPRLRLRELREARGLSQVELARRLHLRSSAHISMLELGERRPSVPMLHRLAEFFDTTLDGLYRE